MQDDISKEEFWKTIQYFKFTEFDSPDIISSGENMDHEFIRFLDCARHMCNFPFTIDSGFRTLERNILKKGSINSAHLRGLAADVRAVTNYYKYKIIEVSLRLGVKRLGIYENHVHVDLDESLPPEVIWRGE